MKVINPGAIPGIPYDSAVHQLGSFLSTETGLAPAYQILLIVFPKELIEGKKIVLFFIFIVHLPFVMFSFFSVDRKLDLV